MSRHRSEQTVRRIVDLVPSREDLIDAGFVLMLMTLALIGFRTTYSGSLYLVAGLAGVVVGLMIAHLANALRQPWIAVIAMTIVVFFLAGGAIALHSKAIGGVLPSGATISGLSDQSVHGWRDLLTTLPPVDGSGPLIVLPYLLGLLGGVGAFCVARRTRWSLAPAGVAFAVLVAVILLGTTSPGARLAQGAVFGVLALGWASLRAGRRRAPLQGGSGTAVRLATAVGLLGVAGLGATVIGPNVPGADSHKRVVLRSFVTPPFDIGQYPSPLAGYRKYRPAANELAGAKLFTVDGLPAGALVQLATLDDYNGLAWVASNHAGGTGVPDTFQRVGTDIDNPASGTSVSYTVTMGAYSDFWLPDAGALTRLQFHGAHAGSDASSFRYNLATGTGVVPDKLGPGDSYSAQARLPREPELKPGDDVATFGAAVDAEQTAFTRTFLAQHGKPAASQVSTIFEVADYLRDSGKFSDGAKGQEQYLPGHYLGRLIQFLDGAQIVGDDEQYAAAFALIINQLGTPARVVLGTRIDGTGPMTVTGNDLRAWVEVRLTDGSWRAIWSQRFVGVKTPDRDPPQVQPTPQGKVVPPPVQAKKRSSLDDATDARTQVSNKSHKQGSEGSGFALPGWLVTIGRWAGPPVLVVAFICALIVGAKTRRRTLRRTRGAPATRLARGWHEVVDHARDLGAVMPARHTRREQGRVLAEHGVAPLADRADAHVFGAGVPDDAAVAAYWADVDAARKQMSAKVGRWRRVRAAVSLASFRRLAAGDAS